MNGVTCPRCLIAGNKIRPIGTVYPEGVDALRPGAFASVSLGVDEAAAQDIPALVGHLTGKFATTLKTVRKGAENVAKLLVLKDAIEALTLLSALKFSLPPVPPSAPALLGIGLSAGSDGVMMGTRIVVSAEWVEMMRQLVRAGVLSLPIVSAAIRIQAGQVMLAQAHGELPKGVREALGDGPEVRAMCLTRKSNSKPWSSRAAAVAAPTRGTSHYRE